MGFYRTVNLFAKHSDIGILKGSMYRRRGIITNTIALVLAFTMPMCCCALKSMLTSGDSCCTVVSQIVDSDTACETQSSCCNSSSEQSNTNDKDKTPCGDDCANCIQDTILSQDWSPPVDTIGTDIPDYFKSTIAFADLVTSPITTSGSIHGPPRFDPHLLGYSSAPSMRGSLILQV